MRITECFGSGWLFQLDDSPEQTGFDPLSETRFSSPTLDDAMWRGVCLPHDWSVEGPFDKDAVAGGDGGFLPCGVGWYRKHFCFKPKDSGKTVEPDTGHVFVRFDGVYQKCDVWLNGHHLGHHAFGYMGFSFDLTPYLQDGGNVLAVRADNGVQPNSRWYSGSGITRSVWLTRAAGTRLSWWGVTVTTEDIGDGKTLVRVSAEVEGEAKACAEIRFAVLDDVIGPEGEVVLAESVASANGAGTVSSELVLADAHHWSDRTPALYRLRVGLYRANSPASAEKPSCTCKSENDASDSEFAARFHGDQSVKIDETMVSFGIRTLTFDKDKGFLIDGTRVKLRGVCLHHDGGCVGAAVPAVIWHRRLLKLKEMGCNAIRMSHNPPDPELLEECDRLGFYVMDEAFDEWRVKKAKNGLSDHGYGDLWEKNHIGDFTDMVRRDRNHPCIILWSIGNEIPEQSLNGGEGMAKELIDLCHSLDPTRLTVSGCDNIKSEPRPATEAFLNTLDVIGANYINRWRNRTELFYSEERHDHPEWRFVGTEHGAGGGFRGRYELDGQEPHHWFGDYRSRMVRVSPLLKYTEAYDFVAGDFMWTGIDYLGECRWPHKNASSGCLDTCGFPKDSFYLYQSVWTEHPMIHLFPHWNWKGREGQVIAVLCCTNCDTAELFLNGKSFGRKSKQFPLQGMTKTYAHFERKLPQPTTADLHLQWDVPYAEGRLEVIGYREGVPVCTEVCETTGAPCTLTVLEECPEARLDSEARLEQSLTGSTGARRFHQLVIRVADAKGMPVPDAEAPVTVRVTGAGSFTAMDNGMPEDRTPFQVPERRTLGGLAYVLVERDGEGVIEVSVSGENLQEVVLKLTNM